MKDKNLRKIQIDNIIDIYLEKEILWLYKCYNFHNLNISNLQYGILLLTPKTMKELDSINNHSFQSYERYIPNM